MRFGDVLKSSQDLCSALSTDPFEERVFQRPAAPDADPVCPTLKDTDRLQDGSQQDGPRWAVFWARTVKSLKNWREHVCLLLRCLFMFFRIRNCPQTVLSCQPSSSCPGGVSAVHSPSSPLVTPEPLDQIPAPLCTHRPDRPFQYNFDHALSHSAIPNAFLNTHHPSHLGQQGP